MLNPLPVLNGGEPMAGRGFRPRPTRPSKLADVLLCRDKQWQGYNTFSRAATAALEATVRAKTPSEKPLQGRMVMIVGTNAAARSLAQRITQRERAVFAVTV